MKKKLPQKSRSKKSESVAHYESILLEGMRSEFRAVAEGVLVLNQKVDVGFKTLDDKIDRESVITRAAMGVMHRDLNQKIDSVKSGIDQKISTLDQKLDSMKSELKADIQGFSTKIDHIDDHLARHDEDIRLLKQAG